MAGVRYVRVPRHRPLCPSARLPRIPQVPVWNRSSVVSGLRKAPDALDRVDRRASRGYQCLPTLQSAAMLCVCKSHRHKFQIQRPIGEVREVQPLQAGDPHTVGPYVLIARLGSGGMGHVFLGRTRGGRTVAVKAVKPELADDPEFRGRFQQEVAAARLVSGRYTAAVVDADPDAAMPWLATAYVSGQTLRAAVAEGWRLPEASLLVLAGGLARALAEIHAAGVVHRDLKPSNVMLAVEGPRVIDFGISRVTAATDYTRTDVGTIVGSPGFMSPEQSRGHNLTGATD